VQRADDTEATVRRRLEIYKRETAPLMEYYRGQGRLREVQGQGSADDVYRDLARVLEC
jgi:adenylate kinase